MTFTGQAPACTAVGQDMEKTENGVNNAKGHDLLQSLLIACQTQVGLLSFGRYTKPTSSFLDCIGICILYCPSQILHFGNILIFGWVLFF